MRLEDEDHDPTDIGIVPDKAYLWGDEIPTPRKSSSSLRLHGLWEGIIDIPPPPMPPYDLETMEPINVPALCYWAEQHHTPDGAEREVVWVASEVPLDDERILVLDGDPRPPDEFLGA